MLVLYSASWELLFSSFFFYNRGWMKSCFDFSSSFEAVPTNWKGGLCVSRSRHLNYAGRDIMAESSAPSFNNNARTQRGWRDKNRLVF